MRGVTSMFFPIENQPALDADLEHALSSAICELYHRYGMFLVQLTAALTTMKHCQFEHHCHETINDEPTDGGRGGKGNGPSSS